MPIAAGALGSMAFLGTEFMPRLEEGSILVQTKKLPGVSLTDSAKLSGEVEKALLTLPEVRGIVSKLGRPDLATDQMGIFEGDVYVLLQPTLAMTGHLFAELQVLFLGLCRATYFCSCPSCLRFWAAFANFGDFFCGQSYKASRIVM